MMRLVHLLTGIVITIIRSVASADTSQYTSITALDKYGSIPQIRNACAASDLHGALTLVTVAASAPTTNLSAEGSLDTQDQAIVVVSLENQIPGILSHGKIQVLSQQIENEHQSFLAIVGSGFKSDLVFLTNLLRRYTCNYWERYDSMIDCYPMAIAASKVMLRFMGYDELAQQTRDAFWGNKEYMDDMSSFLSAIPHVLSDYNQGQDWVTVGRPLGVKCFIVQLKQTDSSVRAHVRIVEPSGVISQPLHAYALGKGSKEANRLIRDRLQIGMTVEQLKNLSINIIKDVVLGNIKEEDSLDPKNHQVIVYEVLDRHGIHRQLLPLVPSSTSNETPGFLSL